MAEVVLRAEVAGPGAHGGIDVRGDGSAEAYTGRWRRVLVAREPGESAHDACGAPWAPEVADELAGSRR